MLRTHTWRVVATWGLHSGPAAAAALGTAPLPARVWLFFLPFALAMVVLEELRKWVGRRRLGGRDMPD